MVDQLVVEIQAVIERHRLENELNYAEVIGALELIKHDIITEDAGDE